MECIECDGEGKILDYDTDLWVECSECEGTGEVDDPICTQCDGSGEGMYDGTKCGLCKGSGVH